MAWSNWEKALPALEVGVPVLAVELLSVSAPAAAVVPWLDVPLVMFC